MGKQIIVLCGHRSGSSVVAGILHYLGVDMGTELMPASSHNPKGYFEDLEFYRINVQILRAIGTWWFSTPPKEAILSAKPIVNSYIKSAIDKHDGVWGWKDPRTALTLPLYWNYLSNPHYVIVERNHLSCAKSINARNNIPLDIALNFTNKYYRRIYSLVQEYRCPSRIVRYEYLLKDTESQIERLSDFVGLSGKVPSDFVDRSLCHQ